MSNQQATYLSNVLANINKANGDIVTITTSYFSDASDTFEVDNRVLKTSAVLTTSSLDDLNPEVSEIYPYKVVTPQLANGSTLILSPSIETFPTASQNYYVPIIFERYQPSILRAIDKQFIELDPPIVSDLE